MKEATSITIRAPLHKVFLAAADLTRWPEFLPHYRFNRFLSQTPTGGVVKMSAIHAGIPVAAIVQFHIDARQHELRFNHLRTTLAATSGAEVVWKFAETSDGGVRVEIDSHIPPALPVLGRLSPRRAAQHLLSRRLAEKTLAGLKRKLEAQQQAGEARETASASRARGKKTAARASRPRKPPRKPTSSGR